ncbi:MAG: ABC transporter permease [Limisphaerales bacterium]
MTVLPIVERELRVAARRSGTYWTRCLFALTVLGLAVFVYGINRRSQPAEISLSLFASMTVVAGLFCLLAGVRFTADTLAEEKRDGTLGLLFLTDLRGYDVVAGKLAASSVGAVYGVLALLPLLAVPLLMGGVTPGQFGRVCLVLLNTLFFSLATGLMMSALFQTARAAVGWTFLVVVGLTGGLPLAGVLLAEALNVRHSILEPYFTIPSPGFAYAAAYDRAFGAQPAGFWTSLGITHALAWLALLVAVFVTPRSWQDRPASATRLRWRQRWAQWMQGEDKERAAYRARLLAVNPFYWLAARVRAKPALVWAVLALLTVAWLGLWAWQGDDWFHPGWFICTMIGLNTLLKSWFAGEAAAQLAEDRRIGALELLLSTPLSVSDIIRGQGLALRRQFLGPVLFVIALHFVFLAVGLGHREFFYSSESRGLWVFGCLLLVVVLVADLVTLFYVTLWRALVARNATRASGEALTRVLALPWLLYAVLMAMIGISGGGGLEAAGLMVVWAMLSLGVDFFFGISAKVKLEEEFRVRAMSRYAPPVPWWKRFTAGGA